MGSIDTTERILSFLETKTPPVRPAGGVALGSVFSF